MPTVAKLLMVTLVRDHQVENGQHQNRHRHLLGIVLPTIMSLRDIVSSLWELVLILHNIKIGQELKMNAGTDHQTSTLKTVITIGIVPTGKWERVTILPAFTATMNKPS
jgi:hypothetical protein